MSTSFLVFFARRSATEKSHPIMNPFYQFPQTESMPQQGGRLFSGYSALPALYP
jgi:hypothetical protein